MGFSVAGLDRACLRRRRSEPSVYKDYKWFRRVRGPAATQAKIAQNLAFLDFKVLFIAVIVISSSPQDVHNKSFLCADQAC